MTDEKYIFITDVAEKKRIARGAFNKRTHNGKGGKVRFPSDYLSNKERNEMNGEVREYRMNSPITYSEFKKYPDDLKKNYVKRLRDMFDVSDTDIAAMMGVKAKTLNAALVKIDASGGRRGKRKADYVAFEKWKRDNGAIPSSCVQITADNGAIPSSCVQLTTDNVTEDGLKELSDKISGKTMPNILRAHDINWDEVKRASHDSDVYEHVAALEQENAILKAKLEMVYLIFGGTRNDD